MLLVHINKLVIISHFHSR